MPFPYNALSFGLQQRLRELSNPYEVYRLQDAVGDEDNLSGIMPLVRTKACDYIYITGDAEPYVITYTKMPSYFPPDHVRQVIFSVRVNVELENLTDDIMKNPVFDHLYCYAKKLRIEQGVLSYELFKSISQRVKNVSEIFMESTFTFPEVMRLFPNVYKLRMPCIYKGWMQDLLKMKMKSSKFDFATDDDGQSFETVFDFEAADLATLFNKPNKFITLNVCVYVQPEAGVKYPDSYTNGCDEAMEAMVEKVIAHLGPQFKNQDDIRSINVSTFNVSLVPKNMMASGMLPRCRELMFTLYKEPVPKGPFSKIRNFFSKGSSKSK
uniref:Uncharacterized protein n=1 Tax=Panagrellus redivivus TaxID=6233 RepID=A0A7E4VQK1_PANRE